MPDAPTTHPQQRSEKPVPGDTSTIAETVHSDRPAGPPWVKFLVLVVVVCLVLAGSWWMNRGSDDFSEVDLAAGSGDPPVAGESATDFTAPTADGETFSLSAQLGTPVWLSFVATWCSSCRTEAPDIQSAWEESAQDVTVASIYLRESATTVAPWAERLGTTYPQVLDPEGSISRQYRVAAVPSHVFINRDGTIHSTHVGILTRDEMTEVLSELSEG